MDAAVNSAGEIFVTVSTNDAAEPYTKVTLQTFCDVMVGEALDRQAESRKLLEMIDSLGTQLAAVQAEFEKIGKALHATTVSAKAVLRGTKQAPGVN